MITPLDRHLSYHSPFLPFHLSYLTLTTYNPHLALPQPFHNLPYPYPNPILPYPTSTLTLTITLSSPILPTTRVK